MFLTTCCWSIVVHSFVIWYPTNNKTSCVSLHSKVFKCCYFNRNCCYETGQLTEQYISNSANIKVDTRLSKMRFGIILFMVFAAACAVPLHRVYKITDCKGTISLCLLQNFINNTFNFVVLFYALLQSNFQNKNLFKFSLKK